MSGYPANILPEPDGDVARAPFLRKPFELHELSVKLRQILDERRDP